MSNIRLIIMACLFNLFFFQALAQQITFSKTYYNTGNHRASSFIELSDSGFILVGYDVLTVVGSQAFSMRTDKFGDSIWTKTYSFGSLYDVIKLTDTSVLACGMLDTSQLAEQIVTLDLNGDTSSFRAYGYPYPGTAARIKKTPDNGYVVKGGQSLDYEFLKLDSNLNEQWHRNVYNMPWGCDQILPDPSGGYVAIGSGNASFQPYEVARFDSAGGQIWQYHYGNQPSWDVGNQRHPRDLEFLPDSNFLICTDGFDWQLMKISRLTGDTIWTKNFYDSTVSSVDYFFDAMDYAGNNRYIIVNNAYYGKIMLVDQNGDTIWTRPRPWINMAIKEIKQTSDGGFAMCGYYYVNLTTFLLAFAKIDSAGNGVFSSVFNPENSMQPLTFYPNPAANELNISPGSMAAEKNLLFTMCDLQGRSILHQQYNPAKPIDVSTLPEGLYVATLKGKEKEVRGKLVIQR